MTEYLKVIMFGLDMKEKYNKKSFSVASVSGIHELEKFRECEQRG